MSQAEGNGLFVFCLESELGIAGRGPATGRHTHPFGGLDPLTR